MTVTHYLKPGCHVNADGGELRIAYRGRVYHFPLVADLGVVNAVKAMNGRRSTEELAESFGVDEALLNALGNELLATPLALDASEVILPNGLSGVEAYWRLEAQVWAWRFADQALDKRPSTLLESMIARGEASVEVVKGFFLETLHQVSNASTEIALAVAHAPTRKIRDLYREFYEEESPHGEILRNALATWIPMEHLDAAVPLPQSCGLIHSYNWWAQTDPLAYAVALIRDEGSALDARAGDDSDIYLGMERHYDVPGEVVQKFRWHAELDSELDHGAFPLEIFEQIEYVDSLRFRELSRTARTISTLYQVIAQATLEYYSAMPASTRWSAPLLNTAI